jgi:hypothetical protein
MKTDEIFSMKKRLKANAMDAIRNWINVCECVPFVAFYTKHATHGNTLLILKEGKGNG